MVGPDRGGHNRSWLCFLQYLLATSLELPIHPLHLSAFCSVEVGHVDRIELILTWLKVVTSDDGLEGKLMCPAVGCYKIF